MTTETLVAMVALTGVVIAIASPKASGYPNARAIVGGWDALVDAGYEVEPK